MVESVKKEKTMFFSNPPMTLPVICFRHLFFVEIFINSGNSFFSRGKLMKPSLNGWTHARKQVLKNQLSRGKTNDKLTYDTYDKSTMKNGISYQKS